MVQITNQQLYDVLIQHGVSRVADEIVRLRREAIYITAERTEDEALEVGQSKFGGSPDLPSSIAWPKWHGNPQAFLAQFNLRELAEYDREDVLPKSGMLYIFYNAAQDTTGDSDECGSWRVLYSDVEPQHLRRVAPPIGEEKPQGWQGWFQRVFQRRTALRTAFYPCRLSFIRQISLPTLLSSHIDKLDLTDAESDGYDQCADALAKMAFGEDNHSGFERSHLLGYPNEIQGPMEEDVQFAAHGFTVSEAKVMQRPEAQVLLAGVGEWRLLLELASENAPDWMWGDGGSLYFWIRTDDLCARRFEQTWMQMQYY